jgi:hypothetical protein
VHRLFLHVLLNPSLVGGVVGWGGGTSHVCLSEGLRIGRSSANGGGGGFITGKYHHDGGDGHFLCAHYDGSISSHIML